MRWTYPLLLAPCAVGSLACAEPSHRHYEDDRVVYERPAPRVYEERRVVEEEPEVRTVEVVAGPEVQVSEFREQLSPYGRWIEVEGYGDCWAPSDVPEGWRPYTRGYWVHSDYGWTWVSEERWGYATCHYGRWLLTERHGWVWVPGRTWAPAWVAWRSGDGYCGWAPLPPDRDRDRVEFAARDADDIPASRYVFCEERYVGEPHVYSHFVPRERNVTIINRTTNITNITVVNNRVVSHGIPVKEVERYSGHRVESVRAVRATSLTEVRTSHERVMQHELSHDAAHEVHTAEHDALHEEHVAEHGAAHDARLGAHEAAHDQHRAEHEAHAAQHDARDASNDAAHEAHVAEHDAAHEKHVAAHDEHVAEKDTGHEKHVAEHDAAAEKHVAEHDAAHEKHAAEHDAHVNEKDTAHEKHVAEHDAPAREKPASEHDAAHEKHVADHDAAHEKHVAEHDAAQAKHANERDAAKDKRNAKDKHATDTSGQ